MYVSFALAFAFFRATYLDLWGVVLCVAMMSISTLFYIIGGQYLVSKLWSLVPISGFQPGPDAVKFLALPVAIALVGGFGEGVRLYRTFFLEEMNKDYVRTARAKGLAETAVLFGHVLKNGSIPILTGVVAAIPKLFLGSLLAESFFGIPGLGSYTIDAIQAQDFAVVRVDGVSRVGAHDPRLPARRHLLHLRRPAGQVRVMPVVLPTDYPVWLLVAVAIGYILYVRRQPHLAAPWRRVTRSAAGMSALVVLLAFIAVGLADSLHFRPQLERGDQQGRPVYGVEVLSLLDVLVMPLKTRSERTYSAPLATRAYARETVELPGGGVTPRVPAAAIRRRASRRRSGSRPGRGGDRAAGRCPRLRRLVARGVARDGGAGARARHSCRRDVGRRAAAGERGAVARRLPHRARARADSGSGRACWRRSTMCSAPTRSDRTCCICR